MLDTTTKVKKGFIRKNLGEIILLLIVIFCIYMKARPFLDFDKREIGKRGEPLIALAIIL